MRHERVDKSRMLGRYVISIMKCILQTIILKQTGINFKVNCISKHGFKIRDMVDTQQQVGGQTI